MRATPRAVLGSAHSALAPESIEISKTTVDVNLKRLCRIAAGTPCNQLKNCHGESSSFVFPALLGLADVGETPESSVSTPSAIDGLVETLLKRAPVLCRVAAGDIDATSVPATGAGAGDIGHTIARDAMGLAAFAAALAA